MDTLGIVATAACGLFAGAALYISLVEHPARMSCGVDVALREWAPSYKRAAVMQAPLAVLGSVAGVLAWIRGAGLAYLVGGLLLFAVVLFTFIVIHPTNTRLLQLHAQGHVGNAEELLARWSRLHAVRSVLGVVAFALMLTTIAQS
jgi:hypothetical protein